MYASGSGQLRASLKELAESRVRRSIRLHACPFDRRNFGFGYGHARRHIAEAPRGTHGFGYDPLFIPKGSTKTLADMTSAEKNAISHRAKALRGVNGKSENAGDCFREP